MRPVAATPSQTHYWTERDGTEPVPRLIGGPDEAPDVIPCPCLVGIDVNGPPAHVAVHVAFELDEIELATLARGGTLWLTTWGGLPIHKLEVVPDGGA